jgi:hypothetical protein
MLKFKEYSSELDAMMETIELTPEEQFQLDEVLDTSARLKRRAAFKRRGARIALARKMQSKRLATPDRLKARAKMRAKSLLIKRLFQGRSVSQIPLSQRQQVSKKLAMMKGSIKRISTKLLRRVKQDDIARKTKHKSKGHSSAGAL